MFTFHINNFASSSCILPHYSLTHTPAHSPADERKTLNFGLCLLSSSTSRTCELLHFFYVPKFMALLLSGVKKKMLDQQTMGLC
jgi:hypothetical protein